MQEMRLEPETSFHDLDVAERRHASPEGNSTQRIPQPDEERRARNDAPHTVRRPGRTALGWSRVASRGGS